MKLNFDYIWEDGHFGEMGYKVLFKNLFAVLDLEERIAIFVVVLP